MFGDIMIYFLVNVMMYAILIIIMYIYFNRNKITVLDFLLLLFNINLYLILLFQDINFFYGIITSILIISIKELCMFFFNSKKEPSKEVFLIKEGIINFHELVNSNYSYDKLIKYLKNKNIKLDEIEYCILKDKKITIIKNGDIKNYPISIIVDGKVMENNLKLINKDTKWLEIELDSNNLEVNLIEYAYFKKDKLYFITH